MITSMSGNYYLNFRGIQNDTLVNSHNPIQILLMSSNVDIQPISNTATLVWYK